MGKRQKTYQYFSAKSFGEREKKVIFFFTAFLTSYWMYYVTIKKLNNAGYYVIVYDIHSSKIFSGNPQEFLDVAEEITKEVKNRIKDLKKQGATAFSTFGTSMGTLLAMRTAIEIPDIQKVVLNSTYGNLGDFVWRWKKLQRIKERFEEIGISKTQLDTLLEPISPIPMAAKLKGKKILLYLAKKDNVILFEHSLQFKEALDKAKVEYVYYQNNTISSHFINCSLNNLKANTYLEFLT